MSNKHVPRRLVATEQHDGQLQKPRKGVREAIRKTSPNRPVHPAADYHGSGEPRGDEGEESKERIVTVQFSVVEIPQEVRPKLDALRNIMHRIMNVAISAWYFVDADKKRLNRNPDEEALGRSSVTDAVKKQLDNEREYWLKEVPKLVSAERRANTKVGQARKSGNESLIAEAEKEHLAISRQRERAECKAAIGIPSAIYDSVVYAMSGKYGEYKKDAFRGERSMATFREGQPVRWRDGSWDISRTAEKKGVYDVVLPIDAPAGERLTYATLKVIPDGPGMYGWAKRMTDAEELARGVELRTQINTLVKENKPATDRLRAEIVKAIKGGKKDEAEAIKLKQKALVDDLNRKIVEMRKSAGSTVELCDARLVYSDKKKQWFAKLVARFSYVRPAPGSQVAAMRRGRDNAFVVVFEGGDCKMISGADVIAFKAKIKARKESVARHLRSLELGNGARGHGKKRRFAALTRIDDAEARFVDTRCKTWASAIVRLLRSRSVGKLVVAKSNVREFIDSLDNEELQAHLRQWPFAKAFDCLKRACEYAGIEIEEIEASFNARRCPVCRHVHDKRQEGTFTCEVCRPEFKRPSDQILAWNMLVDMVGDEPVKKNVKAKRELDKTLRQMKEGAHAE